MLPYYVIDVLFKDCTRKAMVVSHSKLNCVQRALDESDTIRKYETHMYNSISMIL